MLKNRFKITNLATRKKIHKNSNQFQNFKQNNRFLDGFWTANLEIDGFCIQIGSDILKFFEFRSSFSEPKIYLYLVASKNLDVLKSYESESFVSAGLSPVAQDYDTPWHPSFVGILENSQIPTCTALAMLFGDQSTF